MSADKQPAQCKEGGICGVGGYCDDCPQPEPCDCHRVLHNCDYREGCRMRARLEQLNAETMLDQALKIWPDTAQHHEDAAKNRKEKRK